MAIGFLRVQFLKRANGQNLCHKSAYNSRCSVEFHGTKYQKPCVYNFNYNPDKAIYSSIILPDHADKKFNNRETLWNAVEKSELRGKSQVGLDMVFALPDDKCVTVEDRIELTERFVKQCFTKYGIAVQVDIHGPKEGKNWHAHFLGSLRPFDETGKGFSKNKIREGFLPVLRYNKKLGRVIPVFAEGFVKQAVDIQNQFFKEKGYDIRVDPTGFVSQKHIGPQRFRGDCQSLLEENELLKELNLELLKEPKNLLQHITKTHSIFDYNTVEFFVQKLDGLTSKEGEKLIQSFWKQKEIVPLFSTKGEFSEKYTTQAVVDEELQILRNAERVKKDKQHTFNFDRKAIASYTKNLRGEQKEAFVKVVEGDGLVCINGLAGTGKSTLLDSLKNLYKDCGYVVRGLGPDTATAKVLEEKGFDSSENIHKFLFNNNYGKREIEKEKEVWFVDESSKIGNSSLKELLREAVSSKVKVVFTGDISQLSPVERGTAFVKFCEKFGYVSLENVQRQHSKEDREIVKLLSGLQIDKGELKGTQKAIDMIENKGGFQWDNNKVDSIKSLIRSWAMTRSLDKDATCLVLALKKEEVSVLNDVIRLYRKRCGELGEKDYLCRSEKGTFVISEGDSIVFKRRDNMVGVENGDRGVIRSINGDTITVDVKERGIEKTVEFSTEKYSNFQLGYVSTNFGAQGATYDHSFIMMSPQMRLGATYVSFSRHRKSSVGFISKNEISDLSTLKKLSTKKDSPKSTIGLLTQQELNQRKKFEGYTQSNSIFKRAYGKAWESISNWDVWSKHKDSEADQKFFSPSIDPDRGLNIRFVSNTSEHPTRVVVNNSFKQTKEEVYLKGVEATYQRKVLESTQTKITPIHCIEKDESFLLEMKEQVVIDRELDDGNIFKSHEFVEELYNEIQDFKKLTSSIPSFENLSYEKANFVSKYHFSLERCEKIKKNSEGYFTSKDWKNAVVERNKSAYFVSKSLVKEEIDASFGKGSLKELKVFAQKHRSYIDREKQKKASVKGRLSGEQLKLLQDYKQTSEQANVEYSKVLKESKERDISKFKTSFTKEWLDSTNRRNEIAYKVNGSISYKDIKTLFEKKEWKVFCDSLRKHKEYLQNKLSDSKQKLLNEYLLKKEKSAALHDKAKKESEDKGVTVYKTSFTKEWLASTKERNKYAYYLVRDFTPEDLQKSGSREQIEYLRSNASKFRQENGLYMKKLPSSKQMLVDEYVSQSMKAKTLHKIGLSEEKERGISFKNSSVATEFFAAIEKRNEAASLLVGSFDKKDLSEVFLEESVEKIKFQAESFKEKRDLKNKQTVTYVENELKHRMEELCSQLFPEGHFDRNSRSIRFGSKGSLSVNLSGRYAGSFKDFETEEKGGPIALIQRTKSLEFADAMKYAKDFLGSNDHVIVSRRKQTKFVGKENSWVSVQPSKDNLPPELSKVNPGIAQKFDEVARYSYRDENGDLLFAILRIEPKRGGAKQMRPLSFGFNKNCPNKMRWSTVGYQSNTKAIYGLEKLYNNPESPVLIVEGEKATDAASKLLEKEGYVVISWIGGTGSVDKVDWGHLKGRDVTIWPDNDRAGYKASNSIIRGLRNHFPKSIKVVDSEILQSKLPEKWDLADPLPKGLDQSFIKDNLRNAQEKIVPLDFVMKSMNVPKDKKEAALFKGVVGEILLKVEDRLKDSLKTKYGNRTWEARGSIVKEVIKVVDSKGVISKELESSGVCGSLNNRVTNQSLFAKAESGVDPTSTEIQKMKKSMKELGFVSLSSKGENKPVERKILDHSFDRVYFKFSKTGSLDIPPNDLKKHLHQQVYSVANTISKTVDQEINQSQQDLSMGNQLDR